MTAPQSLPASVRSLLDDFVVRHRRLKLLCNFGYALVTFLSWMLVWCLVDRLAHLPGAARLTLLAAGACGSAYLTVRALRGWLRAPDWVAVAEQIERRQPEYGQKLITVTSQILETPDHRGSDQILSRLVEDVARLTRSGRVGRKVHGAGRALVPWGILLALAGLCVVMSAVPGLRFVPLAERFLAPLADVPAVTTTQLSVTPGDADVVQSQPVTIEAQARQLGDSSLTVFLSDDQRDWSAATMTPTGAGSFSFTIQSVDRDLRYYVRGGDARTPAYSVRVLRRPAVARFTVHYAYPPYARLAPATVTTDDGRIEAPVGTHVTLTVTATEPLKDAVVRLENQALATSATSDPASRRAEWDVTAGGSYEVEMTSVRDVRGSGPGGCTVRALPDLAPQVRLLRGGESLSQSPREIVPVSYEAMDDFAVASLSLRWQLNGGEVQSRPLKVSGDPRRQQEVTDFDLAKIPTASVGDVVTLTVVAVDSGGHEVSSLPLQILLSPRSVNLAAYQLITDLSRATQLSRAMANALIEARQAQEQSAGQTDRRAVSLQSLGAKADRALTAASQTAGLLRQALLKAVTHTSEAPEISSAVPNWIDEVEVDSAAAQEAFRASGTPAGLGEAERQALADACGHAVNLADEIETVYRGRQADALIRDLNNLAAVGKPKAGKDLPSSERLGETVGRMRLEVEAEARQLGLDASSAGLSSRLDEIQKTGFAVAAARATRRVNYAMAVAGWANELQLHPQKRLGMDGRLSAAAQAEAIQPEADLTRARDLELASRAAYSVASAVRSGQGGGVAALKAFVNDASTLLGQPREPTRLHPPATQPALRARLEAARIDLVRLSGAEAPATKPSQLAGDFQKEIEDLAMQANAAAAAREYGRTAELEAALDRKLKSRPRPDRFPTTAPAGGSAEGEAGAAADRAERRRQAAQREMSTARRVDELDRRQSQLAEGLESGEQTAALARQQQSVADEIEGVRSRREDNSPSGLDQPDARERATAEVLGAIDRLAGMPGVLAEAQALSASRRAAVERVKAARAALAQATTEDQRAATGRAAEDAEGGLREVSKRLAEARNSLGEAAAEDMVERLSPYAPETDSARDAIKNTLIPAFNALDTALTGDDADAADRAAADTREAIAATQRELASARDQLVKRDPLAAARWFARAAAASLSASPPDVKRARSHQAGVFESLSQAWGASIHRAATERLAEVPSLAAVLGPPFPGRRGGPGGPSANPFANAQEWGRLRDEAAGLDPGLREAEPPGYEQPLKLYFEALGRAGEAK